MSAPLKINRREETTSTQQASGDEQKENVFTVHHSPLTAQPETVRRRAWLAFSGLTAMFLIAALWRPADEPQLVLCPFRALTHYLCPGCGMTRAFCALAHLEFWRAIKFNALSPLLFLVALVAWASAAATIFRIERVRLFLARLPRPTPFATKLMLAFVMLWWAARLAVGI